MHAIGQRLHNTGTQAHEILLLLKRLLSAALYSSIKQCYSQSRAKFLFSIKCDGVNIDDLQRYSRFVVGMGTRV